MNAEQNELIEQMYLEMYEMLLCYARCSLEQDALAEEAVQETFRIACLKPDALCDSPNPKGWLINTLKNTISNMKRSRENARRLLAEYLATQSKEIVLSTDRISLEVMYENLAGLEEFKLIKEMAVDGRSHLEMARARGISVNACKKRVQRAKEFLKKNLK